MKSFLGILLSLVGACFLAQTLLQTAVSHQPEEASDAGYFPITTSIFRGGAISPTLIGSCGAAALLVGAVLLAIDLVTSTARAQKKFEPQITEEMRRSAWYVRVKNDIQGPYSLSEIREWILEKSILPSDLIRMGPDAPFYEVRSLSAVLFGPEAKSDGTPLTRRETYLRAARARRRLIWAFLISLPVQLAAPFMGYFGSPQVALLGGLMSLTITAALAWCIGDLADAMGHSRPVWLLLYLFLGCTPGVPLVILLVINRLAKWHFRAAHIPAGLLGPSDDDVLGAT